MDKYKQLVEALAPLREAWLMGVAWLPDEEVLWSGEGLGGKIVQITVGDIRRPVFIISEHRRKKWGKNGG